MANNLNTCMPFYANVIKAYKPEPNEDVELSLQVAVEEHEFVIVDQIKRVFGKWYQVLSQITDKKGWVPAENVKRIKCVLVESDWENTPALPTPESLEELRNQSEAWAALRKRQQEHQAQVDRDHKKAEAEALDILAQAEHTLKKSAASPKKLTESHDHSKLTIHKPTPLSQSAHPDTAPLKVSLTPSSSPALTSSSAPAAPSALSLSVTITAASPAVTAAAVPVAAASTSSAAAAPAAASAASPSPRPSGPAAVIASSEPPRSASPSRSVSPLAVRTSNDPAEFGPDGPFRDDRSLSPESKSRKEMLEKQLLEAKQKEQVAAVARDEWLNKQKQLADKITADALPGGEKIKEMDDALTHTFTSLRKRLDDMKQSDDMAQEFDDIDKQLAATEPQLLAFNDEINNLPWSQKKTYRDKLRDFRQHKLDLEPLIVSTKTKFKLI